MDSFDYQDNTQPTRSVSALVWNTLTVVVLLAAVCVALVVLMLFVNPSSAFNPFPPPTLPVAISLPTITPTPRSVLPPTWTPLPTDLPTATYTPRPTSTPAPTETPFSLFTPTNTTEALFGMPYDVASGSPVAISSVTFHPEAGCYWMGVAGQVLDISGAPVSTGVVIQLSGVIGGDFVDITSLTGIAPQYGQSGYEFFLGDRPIASNNTLWVQLIDQAGRALSEKIYFETFDDCSRNLVFINFKQLR